MRNEEKNRTVYLAVALPTCTRCGGMGYRDNSVCPCAFRGIFRIVLGRFHVCSQGAHLLRPVTLDAFSHSGTSCGYGHKQEEFMADVWLVAKRTLTQPTEWAIFRFHHLLGADWKLCGRRLGMDKGNFFHAVYRIEQKLGRVFAELKPYALYPIDEYFQPTTRKPDARPLPIPYERQNGWPLRAPLDPRPRPRPVAPTPVPVPDPVPVPSPAPVPDPEPVPMPARPVALLDVHDEAAVAHQVREWYSAGSPPVSIAAKLNRLGVPSKRAKWYASDVQHLLIWDPRAQAPAKRAA